MLAEEIWLFRNIIEHDWLEQEHGNYCLDQRKSVKELNLLAA
jgi:hypothetical protein